jgi:radical SAM superfamily enzyme YgiQ (UPF0313 family)
VWIGSESGSQRILDAMERGVNVEQVQAAIALCKSHGIQTGMFLMWGYEGEMLEDVEATVRHVKTSLPDIFFTTVAYPIKGTPYFREVSERVEPLKPWRVGSDREVHVRGRHSRRFYSIADQLLRSEVELTKMRADTTKDGAIVSALEEKVALTRSELVAASSEAEV